MLTRFVILLSNPKSAPEFKEQHPRCALCNAKNTTRHAVLFLSNVRSPKIFTPVRNLVPTFLVVFACDI